MVAAAILTAAVTQIARADYIPYGSAGSGTTVGVENPTVYTFTAAASGHILAYFAGSTASFDNQLGLMVNGVDTGIYGLDNHSSVLGASLDFGFVSAGSTLVFILKNISGLSPGGQMAFSDKSLNGPYDGGVGHQHVYATPYTGGGPIIDSIPAGTFVSFEDLPAYWPPDWNYNDEDFVFTDVAVSTPDASSTITLLGMGLVGVSMLRRRFVH